MKRILSFLLALITLLLTCASPTAASDDSVPPITHSKCAWVYNVDNNTVLWSKNAEEKIYPASTVKLMTAALAIEYFGDNLSQTITVTAEHLKGVAGNNINLQIGERLTAEQLLIALIVSGANDAANVIAYTVGGSMAGFITMMNAKAKELGMENTIYTNPTGMHDANMKTTVTDIGKIALYTYRLNTFTEIASLPRYIMPATNMSYQRTLLNKNHLVSRFTDPQYFLPEATGMNAGSTPDAGYCVTASAVYDGLSYLCIVTGADRDDEKIYSFLEARDLLEWASTAYDYALVLESTRIICEVPVSLSSGVDHVTLLPEHELELFLPANLDIARDITYEYILDEESLTAPILKVQKAGTLKVFFRGEEMAALDLITKSSVSKSRVLEMLTFIKSVVLTKKFIFIAAIVIILAILYILAVSIYRYQRRHRRYIKRK